MNKFVLPTIVVSQFLCTSVWFAGNAVMPELIKAMGANPGFLAMATSAVQLGFVMGTLFFALLAISDRFVATKVFFTSACVAAAFNWSITIIPLHTETIRIIRFATGFFLAGIYPVGMKIAAEHCKEALPKALGLLVGALVLGTAFPHLVRTFTQSLPWQWVFQTTSALALLGGFAMILFVKNEQHALALTKLKLNAFLEGFSILPFRSAAMGYFGHMWELYTFWAFVPMILQTWSQKTGHHISVPLLSFLVIGVGFPACIISGQLALTFGVPKIASWALIGSGLCCLISPLIFQVHHSYLFFGYMFTWSSLVIADSPLFSSLVAKHAPQQSRGSALTIVNCIGFGITIVSIQTVQLLSQWVAPEFLYLVLAVGPFLGSLALHFQTKKAC